MVSPLKGLILLLSGLVSATEESPNSSSTDSAKESLKESVVSLGQFGTVFEIAEEDMLELILKRAQALKESGKLKEMEESLKKKAVEKVITPTPVENLQPTETLRTFLHDPTLTIDQDIKDHKGNLIARSGQKINPLDHMTLSKGLLFIDGTKDSHLNWAIQHKEKFQIVLTRGSPLKEEEKYGLKFYFDQAGIITKRYGITHVPAKIEQDGKLLKVTEFKIPEENS